MIPDPIPDWLATLFALYCLTGAAFLTLCLGWGAWELGKRALRMMTRSWAR